MKLNLYDVLYNFSVTLFTLSVMWQLDTTMFFYKCLAAIAVLFIIIKILLEKHTVKEYIFMALIMVLIAICFIKSGVLTIILTPLFIFGAKNINLKKVFIFNLWIRIISFIVIIAFSLTGIRENHIFYIYRMTGENVLRLSLGFEHANQLHMHFFIIIILIIYVLYDKFKISYAIIIMLANYILYKYSVSRTGFLSVLVILILTFIFKELTRRKISISKITAWIIPLATTFSLISSMYFSYNSRVMISLNNLLQGRISNSNYYWKLNGVSLLGQKLISDTTDLILDNSYVILWLNFGLIILIIFNILYVITSYQLIKDNNYAGLLMIISFALYGVTEGFLSNIFLNISLIYFSILFYNKIDFFKYKVKLANGKIIFRERY